MLLTVKELANQLHIKPSTLYAWAGRGRIPCLKLHGLVRFERDEIEHWVASFRVDPAPRITRSTPSRGPSSELDPLIAAAKRAVYTPRRGKTRPKSRPIREEETDGAV